MHYGCLVKANATEASTLIQSRSSVKHLISLQSSRRISEVVTDWRGIAFSEDLLEVRVEEGTASSLVTTSLVFNGS